MTNTQLKLLHEQKGEATNKIRKIADEIQGSSDLKEVKDLQRKFDSLTEEVEKLTVQIKIGEQQEGIDVNKAHYINSDSEISGYSMVNSLPNDNYKNNPAFQALRKYAIYGEKGLSMEERANYFTTTDGEGGYTIPTGLHNEIHLSKLAYGGLISPDNVSWLQTTTGNDITIPATDDTGNAGFLVTEKTDLTTSAANMTFTGVALKAYKYSSGMVVVTNELLSDSSFEFGRFLFDTLLVRLWRGLNTAFTTGDGSSKPTGVYATATKGEDATKRGLLRTDLLELYHSVDPAYRIGPKVRWMMNDSTLKVLKAIVLGSTYDMSPMWQESVRVGEPQTIEGKPFIVNQAMEDIFPTYKPVIFGDLSEVVVREAGPLRFVRLTERYAELDQVAFCVLGRFDCNKLAVTGTYPYKFLRNATT